VELDQRTSKAKVWLRVRKQFVLHRNATITKRSESILGDFLLDVGPGSPDQPALQDGEEIRIVIRQPSMNDVFQSLNKIAGDIVALRQNTRDATREARDILKTIGQVVGSNQQQGEFKDTVKSLKTNLSKLDASLTTVQEITDKINKGQGTVGHLINDDKLARNLDKASTQLTNLLGTPDQLKIEVNERSELMIGSPPGGTLDPNDPNVLSVAHDTAYNPWTH